MAESQVWGTHVTWRNDREAYLMRYSLGRMVLYNGVLGGGGGNEWKGDVVGRGRQAITYIEYYIRNSGIEKRCDARYRYPMVIRDIDGTSRQLRRPSGSGRCVQSLPGVRFRQAI